MQERRRKQTLRPRSDTTSPGLPRTSAYSIPRPLEARGRPNTEKRKAGAGGNPLQPKDPGPRPGIFWLERVSTRPSLSLDRQSTRLNSSHSAISNTVLRFEKQIL